MTIRPYRPADHSACRRLWAELTEHLDALRSGRDEPSGRRVPSSGAAPGGRGGPDEPVGDRSGDAGAGFEEYLTQLNLSGMWVAEHLDAGVSGFVGLTLHGRTGAVDPVVVTASMRGHGIGRALVATVADEARRRGLHRLTVSPQIRDVAALHSLHAAGFGTLATVTLAYDLGRTPGALRGSPGWRDGRTEPAGEVETLDLYGLRFAL